MALQKQKIPLSINAGVDTKTDDKNVLATKFLEIVNGDFTETGALSKRFGYDALPRITSTDELIETAKALATFKSELLLFSEGALYTYSEADTHWVDKGSSVLASVKEEMIYSEPYNISNVAETILGGHKLTVYITTKAVNQKHIVYILTDIETNTILVRYELAQDSRYDQLRVEALGNRFIVFYGYADATDQLRYFIVDPASPELPVLDTLVDTYSSGNFHTLAAFGRVYIVYEDLSGNNKVRYYNQNLTGSSAVTLVVNIFPLTEPTPSSCLSVENSGFIRVAIKYGFIRFFLLGADLNYQVHTETTAAARSTVRTIQDPDVPAQSLVVQSNLGGIVVLGKISSAGVYTLVNETCFLGYSTHSDLVQVDGKVFFLISNLSALKSTYLVTYDLDIVATVSSLDTYISTRVTGLELDPQPLLLLDSDTILAPTVSITEAVAGFNEVRSLIPMKVSDRVIDVGSLNNYFSTEAANNTLFSGGVVKAYDGNKLVEHGFLEAPAVDFVAGLPQVEATPGLVGGAAYQYALVYAWRDRFGQIHRSYPAFTPSQVIGSSPNFYSIEISMNFLNLTNKENVELELYRTEGNGTTYYKLSGPVIGEVFINEPSSTSFSKIYRDDTADAALIVGEILYTQGGTIENDAAYPCKYITNYKTRVFTILSDGKSMQYSKSIVSGFPVEFSSLFIIELPDAGGVATCAIQMDDYFIIFKEQAIFGMNGEGPNNLGEQDDYRKPQLIASDCGCVDANSIVLTDQGVFFKSSKGIYLLKRNLSVEYIGAPVERFNDLVITSATLLSVTNQVRFTTDSDVVLVYDYYAVSWAWYEGLEFEDSLIYKGNYVGAKSTGYVLSQSTSHVDVDTHIPMAIESSWIQLAGIQGFQRFWKLLILGTYKGPHKLRVQFAFDFNDAWVEETYIEVTNLMNNTVYGDGALYGDSGVYGGPASLYQFDIRPKRQKCQAFKFRISDAQDGAVIGESMQLSNFALEVGVKQGYNKLESSKVAGTK